MNFLKQVYRIDPTKFVIFLVIIVVTWVNFNHKFWKDKERVIFWDVISYYSYLPAFVIYHDMALEKPETNRNGIFWPIKTPTGKNIIKTSMGLSFLYAPFFFIAHFIAPHLGYEQTGYTVPYKFALQFSSLIYLVVGLFVLSKLLSRYFKKNIVAITLLMLVFGTNILYYTTVEATLSHVYSFCMITVFLYVLIEWLRNQTYLKTIALGLVFGIIVLIRPVNIIVGLFFLFWGVLTFDDFKGRILLLLRSYKHVLLIGVCVLLVWLPQMAYWKMISGQWMYYSYNDEHLFFNNPHIIDGLFSYRKGWYLYTPVMLFATIGFLFLKKQAKEFFTPCLIFFIVNIYVIFSWWCWWYGGGFSIRPMIDSYGIMAFPLAALLSYCFTKKKIAVTIATYLVVGLLLVHSIFQTLQYYYGAIHWDSMTKEAYWDSFGRVRQSKKLQSLIKEPDCEKAKLGHGE